MTELMKKAIAKIDAEGEKGGSNQKQIAQYIIDDLITDDASAAKITDEKKSLADCMKSVENKAKKLAENGCAMIKDDIVYGWVREYYEVEEKAAPSNIISLDLADLL
nr:MAG TPA: PcfK-like protein [Caudoviricetes sp.]